MSRPLAWTSMGDAMRVEFSLEADDCKNPCLFANHGSYGAVPLRVMETRLEFLRRVERQPDLWFREQKDDVLEESMKQAAAFVGANFKDMSFVMNTTEGMNCVIHSLKREGILGPQSGVLVFSSAYGAVKHLLADMAEETNTPVHMLPVTLPIASADALVNEMASFLSQHPNIRVAVLDHITSATALLLPLKEMLGVCRHRAVRTVVDGAHAIGQIPNLDLTDLDPDYYVSNFHKWAFAPKGTAFLYCNPKYQATLRPPLISWDYQKDFRKRFLMQGTRDMTQYASVGAALTFYKEVGLERSHIYRTALRDSVVKYLVQCWWGEAPVREQLLAPLESVAPYMVVLRTPIRDNTQPQSHGATITSLALFRWLLKTHRLIVPVYSFNGFIYVRLCFQIYNSRTEFERLGPVILAASTNFPDLRSLL